MKIISTVILLLIPCVFIFTACKKNEIQAEESFIKIYDQLDGNKKYFPLSMTQTNDEGYLILGAVNGWNIMLMKIDALGEMVWDVNLPIKYVNATPNIINIQDRHYIVCMDNVGLFTYLLEVGESSGEITEVQAFDEMFYPTYAYYNGTNFYIQNYNRNTRRTGIHRLSSSLSEIDASNQLNVIADVEDNIVEHVTFSGRRMPFMVRTTPDNNHVVMSCFYNYSFSFIFLNNNLEFQGVYNGSHFDASINAFHPLGGDYYSVARFSFGNQFFTPKVLVASNEIDITASIPVQGYPTLDPDFPVQIQPMMIGDTNYISFMATSRSNQLVLHFYNEDGVLKGKHHLGQNTPFSLADAKVTADGGLILLVQVKVMGTYRRIATIRLSKKELENIVS